jgi:hypothetical protein
MRLALVTGRKDGAMLMISILEGFNQRRLVLEGTLIGPWATELRTACEKARADLRDRELVVDMKNVTTISQEGENVLIELMNEGVKFPGGVFTKHLLRQISRKLRRKVWYPICVNHKREGHHE